MNILKSLFISTYMMAAMGITMVAGWSLWNTGEYLAWGGVLLVTAPFMMVISWIMMSKAIARTSAHFPVLNALGAGMGAAVMGMWEIPDTLETVFCDNGLDPGEVLFNLRIFNAGL